MREVEMTAQNDPELTPWLDGMVKSILAGTNVFLVSIVTAALRADDENYAILVPALRALKKKYPHYNI